MPLSHNNSKFFHRTLYSGILKGCTLLKRSDDQRQGTVASYKLFECRRGKIHSSGETIQADILVGTRTEWTIPRSELDRIGISYLVNLDRIVEDRGDQNQALQPSSWRYWQPEATTSIDINLFQDYVVLSCVRIDPPNAATIAGEGNK